MKTNPHECPLSLFLALAFLGPFRALAGLPSADDLVRLTRAHLETLAKENHFSGVVLIAKDGKTIFENAYGSANLADNIPNKVDTKFNMASMGKMFTGIATMQLVEAGKVSLDGNVGKYLPDFPNKTVRETVTVHQLLTHTAGLGNFLDALQKAAKERYRAVSDYLPLFADQPLLFPAGTGFAYSNSGYMVLGLIIEAVSGQSYFDYVKEHICGPAGMTHTDAYELDYPVAHMAIGYSRSSARPGQWMNNIYVNVIKGTPAGGGYTTGDDLLKFSNALMENKFLTKESVATLTTGKTRYGNRMYAFGFIEENSNGHRIIGHSGGSVGIADELMIFADLGYTVVILTNGDTENFWDIQAFIKKHLIGSTPDLDGFYFTKGIVDAALNGGYDSGNAALQNNPGNLAPRSGFIEQIGYKLLWARKNDKAITIFKLYVSAFPKSAYAYLGLGEAYAAAGNKSQAIENYQKYLAMEPDDAEVKEKLRKLNDK